MGLQGAHGDLAHHVLVLDEEDGFRAVHTDLVVFGWPWLLDVEPFDARKVDPERRALVLGALHGDRTAVLLGDPVGGREAETAALSDLLGGEERLEDTVLRLLVHAGSGIRDRQDRVGSGPFDAKPLGSGGIEMDRIRGDRQLTPRPRHRVAGIDDQVHQHLLELAGGGVDGTDARRRRDHQLDVGADQPSHQTRGVLQ